MTGENETGPDPVTLSRWLGRRLKALRVEAGKKPVDVEVAEIASRQKLGRLEKGVGPYKAADVRELCIFYGVGPEETEELRALSLRTKEDRIWDDYTDVIPRWFGIYVGLEATANRISTYHPEIVPGLLQTQEYTRAVFRAVRPPLADDVIERMIATRVLRQQGVFDHPEGAHMHAVLSEAVLARQVGGPEVMAVQIQHLRDLCRTGRVEVRVVIWATGAHAAMPGSFTLLEFADVNDATVAYVESYAGARYFDKPAQVRGYREIWRDINKTSIPLEEYSP